MNLSGPMCDNAILFFDDYSGRPRKLNCGSHVPKYNASARRYFQSLSAVQFCHLKHSRSKGEYEGPSGICIYSSVLYARNTLRVGAKGTGWTAPPSLPLRLPPRTARSRSESTRIGKRSYCPLTGNIRKPFRGLPDAHRVRSGRSLSADL